MEWNLLVFICRYFKTTLTLLFNILIEYVLNKIKKYKYIILIKKKKKEEF